MEKNLSFAGKSLIACSNAIYLLLAIQILAALVYYLVNISNLNEILIFFISFGLINLFIVFYVAGELKDAGIALTNAKNEIK